MKLEDQVVSLELAKKLKELGVKQESLWYWNKNFFNDGKWYLDLTYIQERPIISVNGYCKTCFKQLNWNDNKGECDCSIWYRKNSVIVWKQWKAKPEFYSAFTVAELGEMLPYSVIKVSKDKKIKSKYILTIWKGKTKTGKTTWYVFYTRDEAPLWGEKSKKLADVMAKMLIHLVENKLIKV